MIRLGVVGHGGRISGVINNCLRQAGPETLREEIRVVGIVDPNEEGARKRLAEQDRETAVFYPDLAAMMRHAQLDGLLIGTRCHLHTPYAIEAAAYDVPLYLEKPVAVTMEQAEALEKAYEKARCPVVVSFPLRVSPLCLKVHELLTTGSVGRIEHVMASNYVSYGSVYFDHEYRNFEMTRGLFLQKATHDLDYLMFLVGSPIVQVAAMANYGRVFGGTKPAGLVCSACDEKATCPESPGNRHRHRSGGVVHDHPCVFGEDIGSPPNMNEDCSSALLRFANGVHGVYTQVFISRRDAHTRGASISGYDGTVTFDWYANKIRRVRHHEPFSDTIDAGEGLSHFGGDDELALDYLDLVTGRSKISRTPIETGLQSVYSCLAAKQSAETGSFVNVRQVGN